MRQFFLILLLLFCLWAIALPTEAATCRTVADQVICIQKIKRSAKYPWQYRVNLSINGKEQASTLYNCRERIIIPRNGIVMPFTETDLGTFICQRLGG